jgi:RND family efflux transporter MFP subunit
MPALFRRPVFWIVIVLVLASAGACVFMGKQATAKKAADQKAAASALSKTPYAAIASGKADVEGGIIQVAARTAGIIRSVDVQEGAAVSKGQVLAQLEDDQPRLAVANAEAAVSQAQSQIGLLMVQKATAEREYGRLQKLQARNFIAGQAVDSAADAIKTADAQISVQRAAVATAGAALNTARYQLELTRVRAPSNGRVVRRYANPGAGASTLNVSTMFDLEPNTQRIVRAEIAEADIPKIVMGQAVEIVPEADSAKVYVGRVLRRSDEFGARKLQSDDPNDKTDDRVVEVVVAADGAPLLIGQRVLVKFMKPGETAGAPHALAAPPAKTK